MADDTKKPTPPTRGTAADLAVRLLMDLTGDELVLMQDPEKGLYLIPAVMTEDSSEELAPGTIEYQLSDGLPGERSSSEDYTDLEAAVARFRALQQAGGWSARFAVPAPPTAHAATPIPPRPAGPGPAPEPRPFDDGEGPCDCEGAGYPIPGILWTEDQEHVPDEPGVQKVEACAGCERFEDDEAAARVVAARHGLQAVFLEDRDWDIEEEDRGNGYGCFAVRPAPPPAGAAPA